MLVVQLILRDPAHDGLEVVVKRCVPGLEALDAGCQLRLGVSIQPVFLMGLPTNRY
jgi:hypothetical protein